MRAAVLLALATVFACTAPQPTYRELEQISRDYQRQQAEADAGQQAPAPDPEDTCRMAAHADLIGKREGEFTPPAQARVICFNCPVTMDFSAVRLNIELGEDGRVANLRCG